MAVVAGGSLAGAADTGGFSVEMRGLTAATAEGGAAQFVRRALLKTGGSPRLDGENLDHVAALAEAGIRWPPIVVHRQTMRVIDGMHRLRAAALRGEDSVEVEFFDGDAAEAYIAAVRANIAHGLPLTLADRKAAARRILGWQPQRSDRWISGVTGLAAGTVAAIRRDIGTADAQQPSRLGRDGRVRPLDTAAGRMRAWQEISARPEASLREIAKAAGISAATAKSVRDQLRRGDDPAPGHQAVGSSGSRALGNQPEAAGLHDRGRSDAISSVDWSLHRLRRDPSLRYSEAGRELLRQLEFHARGPKTVRALIEAVPSHCGFVIASLGREYARQWLELAETLENQLHNPHPAGVDRRRGSLGDSGIPLQP